MTEKKIKLNLIGLDGNAFSLMGAFQRQARREGWNDDEIKNVIDEAKKGDYSHLLMTLDSHCEAEKDDDDYEWDLDEDLDEDEDE